MTKNRIVHIGAGAFFRAHCATYTQPFADDWHITAVNMHSSVWRDAMAKTHNNYCVLIRDGDQTTFEKITCIDEVLCAAEQLELTIERLTESHTHIVSLTVTEKGYTLTPGFKDLNYDNSQIAHDLRQPRNPVSVVGVIVEALRIRRAKNIPPFTVMSCDNLPSNSKLLRRAVVQFAERLDSELASWVEDNVCFPSTMVDRITPAPNDLTYEDANTLEAGMGPVSVETEPFRQWAIEDNFNTPTPNWKTCGALFVSNISDYEEMKLRMLNGTHSMVAYAGFLKGHKHVRDVMADQELYTRVVDHLNAAALTLTPLPGIDFNSYARQLIARFENPAIAHETYQIASDGTQKLPQRIFSPLLEALSKGHQIGPYAFATAAWMKFCTGKDYSLNDPREEEIKSLLQISDDPVTSLIGLPEFFPATLRQNSVFINAVRRDFLAF